MGHRHGNHRSLVGSRVGTAPRRRPARINIVPVPDIPAPPPPLLKGMKPVDVVPDDLWQVVEPIVLRVRPLHRKSKTRCDREALTAILCVFVGGMRCHAVIHEIGVTWDTGRIFNQILVDTGAWDMILEAAQGGPYEERIAAARAVALTRVKSPRSRGGDGDGASK